MFATAALGQIPAANNCKLKPFLSMARKRDGDTLPCEGMKAAHLIKKVHSQRFQGRRVLVLLGWLRFCCVGLFLICLTFGAVMACLVLFDGALLSFDSLKC